MGKQMDASLSTLVIKMMDYVRKMACSGDGEARRIANEIDEHYYSFHTNDSIFSDDWVHRRKG